MPGATLEDDGAAKAGARPVAKKGSNRRERRLAGACAALLLLGVAAAVTRTSDADARRSRQVAARAVAEQLALEETTTTTAEPPTTVVAEDSPLAPFGPPPSRPAGASLVATALGPGVDVYSSPDAEEPRRTLDNPQPSGADLVMLVREERAGRVRVLLPVRPNGASGWVNRDQIAISETSYYIVIGLAAHRITVFSGSSVVLDERIGLGAGGTPTPTGLFYIKELFQPPNPRGPYGPYAYGLSAFSEVLFSFGGGPGTVGVHGTNDPSSLGRNVSHGCIRMSNAGVTKLAKMLPLGVPVQITA